MWVKHGLSGLFKKPVLLSIGLLTGLLVAAGHYRSDNQARPGKRIIHNWLILIIKMMHSAYCVPNQIMSS